MNHDTRYSSYLRESTIVLGVSQKDWILQSFPTPLRGGFIKRRGVWFNQLVFNMEGGHSLTILKVTLYTVIYYVSKHPGWYRENKVQTVVTGGIYFTLDLLYGESVHHKGQRRRNRSYYRNDLILTCRRPRTVRNKS